MVPDKFNMVDMGGIDILDEIDSSIPGLYQRLHDAVSLCAYACIYNWSFNGIYIPPTNVTLHVIDNGVKINDHIWVSTDDVIHLSENTGI